MKIKEFYLNNKDKYLELFGKTFFSDVISISLIFITFLLVLTMFLILAFRVKSGDYLIPLVYNSTYGVTALGAWYKIYLYPLAFLGFSLINFMIAWAYFEKERLITYLVLFVNILAGFLFVVLEYNLTVLLKG